MIPSFRKIRADEDGAAIIEFAIAVPVLVSFIWGIFQVGLLFQASAGMQHALGEAARFATIFPTPSDADIKARVTARKFGTGTGTLDPLEVSDNVSGTTVVSKTLTLTYKQPMNFLFFKGPTVTLTRSKVAYIADPNTSPTPPPST